MIRARELMEESVKFSAFGKALCRDWHNLADLEAFVKKQAGSFDCISKEPS
jgi:hypothetical protein